MSKYVGFKIGKLHEERVISEYYCGGCGWPLTDHDSFCPECGGALRVEDSDQRLEDENAKLRKELEQWHQLTAGVDLPEYPLTEFHPKNLERENDKMRELLAFYLGCLTKGHVNCDSCAFSGDGNCGHGRMVIDKARELGIEANDG